MSSQISNSHTAVLFDLGNTLAAYYRRDEFRPILAQAIESLRDELIAAGKQTVPLEQAIQSALQENREAADYRVTPIMQRFERIFHLTLRDEALNHRLCECFLEPIFAIAHVYDDVIPTLEKLKNSKQKTAIVSNTPWGSPAGLWRNELTRLGLTEHVDAVVFCMDVGWRKPDARVFLHTAKQLGVACQDCIFVGMRAVLIDRQHQHTDFAGERISRLDEVLTLITSA